LAENQIARTIWGVGTYVIVYRVYGGHPLFCHLYPLFLRRGDLAVNVGTAFGVQYRVLGNGGAGNRTLSKGAENIQRNKGNGGLNLTIVLKYIKVLLQQKQG